MRTSRSSSSKFFFLYVYSWKPNKQSTITLQIKMTSIRRIRKQTKKIDLQVTSHRKWWLTLVLPLNQRPEPYFPNSQYSPFFETKDSPSCSFLLSLYPTIADFANLFHEKKTSKEKESPATRKKGTSHPLPFSCLGRLSSPFPKQSKTNPFTLLLYGFYSQL